jgi:hypothetical protein
MEMTRARSTAARRTASLLLTILSSTLALPASAQTEKPAAQPATAAQASAPGRAEAEARYRRALELFNEGNYDASLLELRRAYVLAPSYRILYNVALVNVQLADYAAALDAFERYLSEGGAEVPPSRAEEVKGEIVRLSPRVASLSVTVDVPGADISVDDLVVGKAPLPQPLRLNAGRRRISVAVDGRLPQSRVVELAGGDDAKVDFKLEAPRAAASEAAPVTASIQTAPAVPERSTPWVPWVVTGVLAATATTTGILALQAHSQQKDLEGQFGVQRAELDDQRSKVKRWALITDIAAGGAAVAAGIALYVTLRHPNNEGQAASNTTLFLGPTRIGARVSF